MVEKIGGSVQNTASDGNMDVHFHPTESAAIIFCNEQLFFVKGNSPQESFELWKWHKIDDVKKVRDLKWNVSVNLKRFAFNKINLEIMCMKCLTSNSDHFETFTFIHQADGSQFALLALRGNKMTIYNYLKTTTHNEIGIHKQIDVIRRASDFAWNPFAVNQLAILNKVTRSVFTYINLREQVQLTQTRNFACCKYSLFYFLFCS